MNVVLIDVNWILARSGELEERLLSFFSLPLVQTSNRLKATQALASLGFEHARSLKYLIARSMHTSAAVLLRVQYESLVRAIWVLYCATDAQADQMMAELSEDAARRTSKLPMVSLMLEEIEFKAPHSPIASLKEFKQYSWSALNSFVHGGLHAVSRHSNGFPPELVRAQVFNSNGLLGIAGNLLLILGGLSPEEGVMAAIYAEFGDCFPLPKASSADD